MPGQHDLKTDRPQPDRCYVIAEAGVNHNGSLDTAIALIEAAKRCDADAVKFQTFSADRLVTREARKAAYQMSTVPGDDSQYAMLKSLELGLGEFSTIKSHCDRLGIDFLSSPFDIEAVDLLDEMDMRFLKIPSGEITNLPFLRHIGSKRASVILSTGMSTLDEVVQAVNVLKENDAGQISLLHCVTEYPAPEHDINLRAMETLRQTFKLPVGYSDHTAGIEVSIAAVAMGACIIEKHFTLDTEMEGPDHKASLDPSQFAQLVTSIRNVEKAMGDGVKRPADCEIPNMDIARKSIVAATDIPEGTALSATNLAVKRPGSGISPMRWDDVIGRVVTRDIKADAVLDWQDLS